MRWCWLPVSLLPWRWVWRAFSTALAALGARRRLPGVRLPAVARSDATRTAMRTFRYSIVYLFGCSWRFVLDKRGAFLVAG